MSAIYGVRYTCDACGHTFDSWRHDGDIPKINRGLPVGWQKSPIANSGRGGTYGRSTVWQRPIVCADCVHVMTEWTRKYTEYDAARRAFAAGPDRTWPDDWTWWREHNPRPIFPFGCYHV